jgi:hypothetical protein
VNLSSTELEQFSAEVGDSIKVDIAESKGIAKAIIENSSKTEFVIVFKSASEALTTEGSDE